MKNNEFDIHIDQLRESLSKNAIVVPLHNGESGLALLDPIAGRIVGSHYALSHYCAGLIMLYNTRGDEDLLQSAEQYLTHIESTHEEYSLEKDYHYDFNNFAWALLLLVDRDKPGFLPKRIRDRLYKLLISTPDSMHVTVNWLPMRALNNFVRFEHTGSKRYLHTARGLLKKVSEAQNLDGMYDDLLPKDLSGNIQYHVFTTAIIQLIRHFKLDNGGGSLKKAFSFTMRMIDPEGDFNYFGRGANQIFGWGPFFFNLEGIAASDQVYDRCWHFFSDNLSNCLKNNGLLLKNSCPGQHNYWWDYHFFTVYASQLFFWLNLLQTIAPEKIISSVVTCDSNLKLISSEESFCAVFSGKSHYLCERGPQICNIWTKNRGSIFKGPFGPFFDTFGSKHISKGMVVLNYFGPIAEASASFSSRVLSPFWLKLLRRLKILEQDDSNCGMVLVPLFPSKIAVDILDDNAIGIEFRLVQSKAQVSINIPLFPETCSKGVGGFITAEINGIAAPLFHVGSTYGIYGRLELFRTQPQFDVCNIKVRILATSINGQNT